jgi:hypothetical protein
VIRLCLFSVFLASLVPNVALAQDDDFLADAIVETKEEKKQTQPLFLIPLQAVWKTIEPQLVDDAVKNIAAELFESGGFQVEQYNPSLGGSAFQDPEPSLRKRWLKEIRVAENNTRKRRFSQAIKAAGRVVRQVMQNPEHLRDPRIYCRAMVLVAEGELRRGRRNKSLSILDMVASNCGDLHDTDSGAILSDAFTETLADAVAEVRRRSAGTLTVHADEPNSTIYLNGMKMGPAPLVIRNLPPGRHLLAVVKEGHKPFGKLVKVGSEKITVQARLTKPLGGGKIGRIFTEMRDNRMTPQALTFAAELLKKHGGKAPMALIGGIAKAGAIIKVSIYAVDRQAQAIALKPMSFDVDFLGLAPEMLGFTEKLVALSAKFVAVKVNSKTLIADLQPPQQDAQPVKWASLALGGERKSLAQQGNARGPLKRGVREEGKERKERKRPEKRSLQLDVETADKKPESNRRDEEDVAPRRQSRRRSVPVKVDDSGSSPPNESARPDRRRARKAGDGEPRSAGGAKGKRRSRRSRARIDDDWGIKGGPKRLRKRSRSRVNWPLITGASAVGIGVVGGGIALWLSYAAAPSAVNANVTWTVPQ